jgi:hypothetical protein
VPKEFRYVTDRTNADGSKRFYWQRRGHKLTLLSGDPEIRFVEQHRLNANADRKIRIADLEFEQDDERAYSLGTIGWTIARYKKSTKYTKCKPGTKKYYNVFLQEVFELGPHCPFEELGPIETQDFLLGYGSIASQRKAKAVLSNLFETAIFATAKMPKPVKANWCLQVSVSSTDPREIVWEDDEIEAWNEASERHKHGGKMRVAMALMRYTAQRQTDCLNMLTGKYDGAVIALKQEKTKKHVEVPSHRDLRKFLDAHLVDHDGPFLVPGTGDEALPYASFSRWFAEIRTLAGLRDELQPRDLRRTGMTRMNEAGATVGQIAAVSGHSITKTQKILETYLKRTLKLAKGAIEKWEKSSEVNVSDATAGGGFSAEAVKEMRERFGLTDQQIAILQVTSAMKESNVDDGE